MGDAVIAPVEAAGTLSERGHDAIESTTVDLQFTGKSVQKDANDTLFITVHPL